MSYSDLVNIDEFETRDYFKNERWDVAYYCKDCKKIVETCRANPKRNVFSCNSCQSKSIWVWTQESLKSHYKIK